MTVERYLRLIAGSIVLVSVLLGYFYNPAWFLLTGFVALNLIQSAFTNWCPMMSVLRWLGVKGEGDRSMAHV
jgi:Inner membrane protein YgaP-like, transmembrane domain